MGTQGQRKRTRLVEACLLGAAAVSVSQGALALQVATAPSIRAAVARNGAKATVDRLLQEKRWEVVEDHISSGDGAWIALAPELSRGTDAGTSEGLSISLAEALPKNPLAVLRVLEPADGPVLGASRVCSLPFIEPTSEFVRRYRSMALSALSRINDPGVGPAKRACLASLAGS